ncbi:MAG: von Willebrand factor type A domain-containing protein [Deltaproteobacteria bacterium]
MAKHHLYPQPADPVHESTAFLQPEGARPPPGLALALSLLSSLCACSASDAVNLDYAAAPSANASIAPLASPATSVLPERNPSSADRDDAASTNPFVMVAHDPLSTFATDADTASYDWLARTVADGGLPTPVSVRLEDYVNYFQYAYPTPAADAEVPFSISLAAARHPLGNATTLLRVGLQGKAVPEQEKKPANLTFLVDVSGSMQSQDKLPLVQQVLRQTLELLEPEDTVSIVSYASDTRVRLEPTRVAEGAAIVRQINLLTAGGSTAGASGIELAYAQAQRGFLQGGINHVILCTDGDFNVGPSSNQELVALIAQKRRSGVTLTALGFGTDNLNDSMMEAVSNAGNGFYGYIGSESQAADYVHERMLSTLTLIAKDVKVQVELNPEYVLAYRLLGYEDRAIADRDFRNDVVDAGEVGAGHRVTALYELVLSGGSVPLAPDAPAASDGDSYQGEREIQAQELVRVKLRYKPVDAAASDPALEVLSSLSPDPASDFAEADSDLAWAFGVAAFAEILKGSPYANASQLPALDAIFAGQADRDPDRAAFYRLFRTARSQL